MSIWTDLLMQHGHVADVELARSLSTSTAPGDACDCSDCTRAASGADGEAQRCGGGFRAHGISTLCATALSAFR